MEQDFGQSKRILYHLLEWLSQQEGGPELRSDFERDPKRAASRLRVFLARDDANLPSTLATYVLGGRVEELVNIATKAVHIHFKLTIFGGSFCAG